ncbi:ferritin heavy chain-like [Diceros bicornis minor]|uniref:ferritin heavy chain-like n=1 Tax=Diceros bicornis minor TaxID=77932 RepID=UPI0026F204B0|nr:ferritin heavy chain-like [Diceros bicornis minor]
MELGLRYYSSNGKFYKDFLQELWEEKEHSEKLIWLQNQHGGHMCLGDIKNLDHNDWESSLKAMECTFHVEKSVHWRLLDLHQLATDKNDAHLCDFLEHQYLVKSFKELGGYLTNLCKMRSPEAGMAEYLFDKLTLGDGSKNRAWTAFPIATG